MINKQELRIGNWVEYDGKYYKIDTIANEFPTLNTSEFGIGVVDWNNINPIHLTEEILLKCGFEKTDDYGDQIYYEPKNRGNRNYYICFDHEDISFGLNVFGNCTNLLHDNSNLQFLHQLQNLYFALTGEELTVNL